MATGVHDVPLVLSPLPEKKVASPADSPEPAGPLHFAHANGFPVAAYRQFLAPLKLHFQLHSTDFIGHHPDFPVTNNWPLLCAQLIADVERTVQLCGQPVTGVGHSLGGGLMFMASVQRPELFHRVIVLDVPFITAADSMLYAVLKKTPWRDRFTPASRAVRRRARWPDHEAAFAYLRPKALFRRFSDTALRDYITAVTEPVSPSREPAIQLRFRPEIEAAIFRTYPTHWLRQYQRRHSDLVAIVGEDSHLIKSRHLNLMRKRLGIPVVRAPGGHLFPLECPQDASKAVLQQVQTDVTGAGAR